MVRWCEAPTVGEHLPMYYVRYQDWSYLEHQAKLFSQRKTAENFIKYDSKELDFPESWYTVEEYQECPKCKCQEV